MSPPDDSRKNYEEAIYLVVADCFNASSQKFTLAEQMATAKTWTRILFDIIPENRLDDVLDLAFQKHDSSFTINAYDLKNRWTELQESEKAAASRAAAEDRAINRVLHCRDFKKHRSETEAMQEYLIPGTGEYKWLPCAGCRYDAHWQMAKEIKRRLENEKSAETIVAEMPEFQAVVSNLTLAK